MPANTTDLEKRLWEAADELRANSKLKSSEYSIPVLGLIFLRYADWKFTKVDEELKNTGSRRRGIIDILPALEGQGFQDSHLGLSVSAS